MFIFYDKRQQLREKIPFILTKLTCGAYSVLNNGRAKFSEIANFCGLSKAGWLFKLGLYDMDRGKF